MDNQQNTTYEGLLAPRRYWAATAVALGIMLSVMDSTVVNVALPTIAKALQISESSSVWVLNAYNLSILALLLPCAALGERLGLQVVFRVGLIVFVLGSTGFIFANTLAGLCLFKVLQGAGAAAMMSMMGGLTRYNYPSHLFGRGIGINAMVVAVSSMMGPIVCSAILYFANWHWLSFLNIPLGVLALYMSRHLPQTPCKKQVFDGLSAILSAVVLCLFVYSVDSGYQYPVRGLVGVLVACVCAWLLIKRANKQESPLVPIDLMHIESFRFAVYASGFSFAGYMVALVALPFHLQYVFGIDQLQTGYMLAVWPVGSGVMALLAARLSERYSASVLAGIGAVVMAVAMLGLACIPASTPKWVLLIFITLVGVGFGFFQMPNNKAMLTAAPKERSGAAGGVQATTRVFSQSMGAAWVALALTLPREHSTTIAFLGGCLCALAAVVVNVTRFKAHVKK